MFRHISVKDVHLLTRRDDRLLERQAFLLLKMEILRKAGFELSTHNMDIFEWITLKNKTKQHLYKVNFLNPSLCFDGFVIAVIMITASFCPLQDEGHAQALPSFEPCCPGSCEATLVLQRLSAHPFMYIDGGPRCIQYPMVSILS